ncbi:PTS IIA-like nitrogen regulatory protein PtsN [Inmirania thermothiophila]|uniref:Phosphotransferase IIA-like nitrogen-regulatory protein PtsN n=1 Tax=Inmirania thermothiophila TaxID=1750597 RepID=A0A3N1XSX5_9GAMM|nr:PTS IIA-like nitrogen regulatory protein PtsN [Inmirania thermothiophila]ROR29756.1 phosphotransferase IIA-like nitrogen-regulatory protein PtsN [Inmirania thermothiophila]
MRIADLLSPDRVAWGVEAASKKRALETLSHLLADAGGELDPVRIFETLLGRERLGSTGLGHGVALPHGRLGHGAAVGALLTLRQGVDFDALDEQPVDLLFGLVVPEEATEEHLQILAELARMFSDEAFCARLREAGSSEALLRLVQGWPEAATGAP